MGPALRLRQEALLLAGSVRFGVCQILYRFFDYHASHCARQFIFLENVRNILGKKHKPVMAYLIKATNLTISSSCRKVSGQTLNLRLTVSAWEECCKRGMVLLWSTTTGRQVGVPVLDLVLKPRFSVLYNLIYN